ncbi:unnamed protein product, partial [Brassica rapa subsp. narinosa]
MLFRHFVQAFNTKGNMNFQFYPSSSQQLRKKNTCFLYVTQKENHTSSTHQPPTTTPTSPLPSSVPSPLPPQPYSPAPITPPESLTRNSPPSISGPPSNPLRSGGGRSPRTPFSLSPSSDGLSTGVL